MSQKRDGWVSNSKFKPKTNDKLYSDTRFWVNQLFLIIIPLVKNHQRIVHESYVSSWWRCWTWGKSVGTDTVIWYSHPSNTRRFIRLQIFCCLFAIFFKNIILIMKPSRAMSFTSPSINYQMIPIHLTNLNCGSDKRLIMSLPMVIRRLRLKNFSRRILKNWRKLDLLQPKLSNWFWPSDEGKNQITLLRHSLQPVPSFEILNMIRINLNFIMGGILL